MNRALEALLAFDVSPLLKTPGRYDVLPQGRAAGQTIQAAIPALEDLWAERNAWRLIAEGRGKLNTAYRLGTQRGAATGLDMVRNGEKILEILAKAKGGE